MAINKKQILDFNLITNIIGNDNILIQREDGLTVRAHISSLSGTASFINVTYQELYDLKTNNSLKVGAYYLITDFRTCYDQPDYDINNNPITTGIYKQSNIEPIIVLSLSSNTISDDAYQPTYPNDKIKYDINWNITEITSNAAYGRITERIDEFNNRTDYDHRTILFKRYRTYFLQSKQDGQININGTTVTGNNTFFTNLSVGNVISVSSILYRITAITDDLNMEIEGVSINNGNNLDFYVATIETNINGDDRCLEMKVNNIPNDNYFREFKTFQTSIEIDNYNEPKSINNYIGNYSKFFYIEYDILLSSDFLAGFYPSSYNNTYMLPNIIFGIKSYSNVIGDMCNNLSATDYFFNNTINGLFINNTIKNQCSDNIIGVNFSTNIINNSFSDNIIGNSFAGNTMYGAFNLNTIGNGFISNILYGTDSFIYRGCSSNIIGDDFSMNTIYSTFALNTLKQEFKGNVIGTPDISKTFISNTINNTFKGNIIIGNFQANAIDFGCTNNNLNDFSANIIGNQLQNNNIGSTFENNVLGNNFFGNTIGNGFQNNTIGNNFTTNTIGTDYTNNIIMNTYSGNTITNNYNFNTIRSVFNNNTVGDNFNMNDFECDVVTSVDFTSATHVYNNYNCQIIKGNDSIFYLKYFNGTSDIYTTITE